ncbi:MAG: TSUP family transporter [Ignavibacteriales bacterium]|nr:TSUP family transporter [Ignavibacteriales bacterium]
MEIVIISLVSLFVAGLTFFSGFGLGTLLMPAFALFFPVEIAVAATAIVHLANNIYKGFLMGKYANLKVVMSFTLPAALTAIIGAYLLGYFSELESIAQFELWGNLFEISPVKLAIGILMIIFALVELIPFLKKINFSNKMIPIGGLLSGFFGGISGHQGALRTAFLVHAGLEKKSFIGTMVLSAIVIDVVRLTVYGLTFLKFNSQMFQTDGLSTLLIAGIISAFVGSSIGKYLLEKVTFNTIHIIVGIMLMLLGFSIALGLI